MKKILILSFLTLFVTFSFSQKKILFDATKAETAGSADWVIDADSYTLRYYSDGSVNTSGSEATAQQTPTPAQSGITGSTSETYWNGAISEWGVELVKLGYSVETLPWDASITYGDGSNTQDLSNYDVFVVDEPNIQFTSSEKTAILNFVNAGGGLFMVSDHGGATPADRNGDGWNSTDIWNDLMSTNQFGMQFDDVSVTDNPTSNIPNLPGDPLLHGTAGDVSQMAFFGAATMTINTGDNSTVKGVVFNTGESTSGTTGVMVAYSEYGSGRVVGLVDSSPTDDGTSNDSDDNLYDNWDDYNNSQLILNATIWLANAPAAATLSVNPSSLTGYTYVVGNGPSSSQSFDLSGSNLDGTQVTVTAPINYEVSTDNTTFSASVTVSYTAPTLAATTIYVRLKAGLAVGTYNGENVTCSDDGAASDKTVSNDGSVTSGASSTCEDFDTGLASSYTTGTQTLSTGDWYTVSVFEEVAADSRGGTGHAARINDDTNGASLRTPALNTVGTVEFYYRELNSGGGTFDLQTSPDNSTWTTLTSQAFSGNTYTLFSYAIDDAANPVYVRIVNDSNPGHLLIDDFCWTNFSGTSPTLTVSPTSLTGYSYIFGNGPSTSQSFSLSGTDLDGTQVTVTAPTNYEVSTDNTTFSASVNVSYAAPTLNATTIYVRLKAGLAVGPYNGENVTCSDDGAASNKTVSNDGEVLQPTLTVSPSSLTGYTYVFGSGPSSSQNFDLSGSNLDGTQVSVTAPANYEVSTDNTTFTASVNVSYTAPTLNATTIYVRLKAGLSVGTYNGENVTCSDDGGASDKTVSNDGEVTALPSITLADNGTQVAAADVLQGTTKHILHTFKLTVADNSTQLSQVDFTSAGTYIATDITKFQLWYNTANDFSAATQIGTDITLSLGTGSHSFTSLGQNLATGDAFFWITTDIDAAATVGNTINSNAVATSNLTFTSGNKSGSTTSGGTQTIIAKTTCAFEDFINAGDIGSYTTINWTGTDGFDWTATDARSDLDLNADETIMLRNGSLTNDVSQPNGTGTIEFDYARIYTGNSTLKVFVNGTQYGGDITVSSTTSTHFSTVANEAGNVDIELNNSGNRTLISNLQWSCYSVVCAEPTVQASGLTFSSVSQTSMNLTWTNGDGSNRIVVAHEAAIVDWIPADLITYTANSSFGSGTELGTGNYVVYNGSGNSFTITNLTPGTVYYFKIYEYGCLPGSEDYLISGTPEEGNETTLPNDVTDFQSLCATATTAELTWTLPTGSYDGILITGLQGASPDAPTCDGASLTTPVTDFSTANVYCANASGSVYLFNNVGTSVSITGLTSGQSYTFKAFVYQNSSWSAGTEITLTAEVSEVSNETADCGNTESTVSWTNPVSACYDEILVVANETAGIGFTPSGDGSAYTANPVYAAPDQVVYKGTGENVTVTSLTNGTTYYFEIFVRNGTDWSSGVELSCTPSTAVKLDYGDLAIVGINTHYIDYDNNISDDEIQFVCFKDITTETSIDFTDNGYERLYSGKWADSEGTIRLTRTGADVPAGTVITVRGKNAASNWHVFIGSGTPNGSLTNDDANWTITDGGAGNNVFDLNVNDQIWMMQGGEWNNPSGVHNSTYSGKVLYGWTAVGWEPAPGYDDTKGSTIFPSSACSVSNLVGVLNEDKVRYDSLTTATTQRNWISRFNDEQKWTGYTDSTTYQNGGTLPDVITISGTGFSTVAKWTGETSSDWDDCANWLNLKVPDNNTDVEFVSDDCFNDIVILSGQTVVCKSLDISGTTLTHSIKVEGDASSILEVHGDVAIGGPAGVLDFDDGTSVADGILKVYGDWYENTDGAFLEGNSSVEFIGSVNQSINTVSASADFYNLKISNSSASGVSLANVLQVNGLLNLEIYRNKRNFSRTSMV